MTSPGHRPECLYPFPRPPVRRPTGLLSLPGIDRYIAGAILSVTYGEREAILDGNVIRVLIHLFCISDGIR